MDRFKIITKNKINELPQTAGVYCFLEKNKTIYIGKAINIKNRVKNHFHQPSYRDNIFMDKVDKVGYLETNSEIEALILEANLIKKHQPKFNVMWRDDKNYFYVAITMPTGRQAKEEKPMVYITHQKTDKAEYIGPFVEGTALKKTLRFLRRAFPYYSQKNHPKTKCTYCHLDLCPGPNPDLKLYKKNIKKLILILEGKRGAVLNLLRKEMKQLSKDNKFEEAGKIRDRMHALQQIMAHTHVMENSKFEIQNSNTNDILAKIIGTEKISRIECYDVSNIQGKQATASMVVFTNGAPDKNEYRKFKIKMENKPNDIAMLKEAITRRLNHLEWKFPDVILIDGGIAQLNVAIKVKDLNLKTRPIKVISIAKRNKELFIEGRQKTILLKTLPQKIYNLIIHLDDEAHRFAITYHKKLRSDDLLR